MIGEGFPVRFVPALVAVLAAVLFTAPDAAASGTADFATWTLSGIPGPDGTPLSDPGQQSPVAACPTTTYCQVLTGDRYLTTVSGRTATTVDAPQWTAGNEEGLNDVACAGATNCVAVGFSSDAPSGSVSGFREELDGRSWVPEDGTYAANNVGCNIDECVAIGTQFPGVNLAYLDDRDRGGSWHSRQFVTPWQSTPGPGWYIGVDSVACPRSGACYVLGETWDDRYNTRPLFLYRSGDIWKGVTQALPAGADPLHSDGVTEMSCPAPRNCIGLGTYVDQASGTMRLFAEQLTDGVLSAVPVPTPPPGLDSRLSGDGLDCASMSECVGGAGWLRDQHFADVLVRFHAGVWSYRYPPEPPHAAAGPAASLQSFACASTARCLAVGSYPYEYPSGKVRSRPAVWTWSAGHWAVRALARPVGLSGWSKNSALTSIACPGPSRCVVTGYDGDTAVYGIGSLPG